MLVFNKICNCVLGGLLATLGENIRFYTNLNSILLQGARTDLAETLYNCKLYLGDLILKKSALAEHFDNNMIFMPHCDLQAKSNND